jgi:hypothetical protein
MMQGDNCPRCREGRLIERVSHETELDSGMSIVMGLAMGTGFFPMNKSVRYANYTCDKNCGYSNRERKSF